MPVAVTERFSPGRTPNPAAITPDVGLIGETPPAPIRKDYERTTEPESASCRGAPYRIHPASGERGA